MVATPARVSPSLYRGWRPTRLQTAGLELFVRIQGQVHTVIHHWCLSLQTDHWSVFSRSRLWQWCNVLPPEGEGLRVWPTGSEGCGDIARQGLAEWCNTLTLNLLLAPAHSDGVQGLPDHALHWFKVPVLIISSLSWRRGTLLITLQGIQPSISFTQSPICGIINNWKCHCKILPLNMRRVVNQRTTCLTKWMKFWYCKSFFWCKSSDLLCNPLRSEAALSMEKCNNYQRRNA